MSDDGATGYHEVVVRDAGDLGYTNDSEPPGIRGTKDHGWGTDLKTPAWSEIRDRLEDRGLDVEELEAGTHVATIRYDLDAWTYEIEWILEDLRPSTVDRLREWFR